MKYLMAIQGELKAPKGQYNSYGKYRYRSAEDILEAVKPICHKNGCLLTLSDELLQFGERYYVKATAVLRTPDTPDGFTVSAFAREEESRKGMSADQLTGSTSSYARKYCLNGLFCIDDAKDSDTDEFKHQQNNAPKVSRADMEDRVVELCDAKGKRVSDMCNFFKVTEIAEMTDEQLASAIKMLSK